MITKSQMIKAIQDMDEDVTFDEVIERLYFLHKVNKGLIPLRGSQKSCIQKSKVELARVSAKTSVVVI